MNFLYQLAVTIKLKDIGAEGIATSDTDLVQNILNPVYMWAGAICVIIIIAAGIMYVISSGSADKIKRAKNAIIGSLVGLVIIMLAFVITQFVVGRF